MKTAPLEKAVSVALAANRHPVLLTGGTRDTWGLIPNPGVLWFRAAFSGLQNSKKIFYMFLNIYFLLQLPIAFLCVALPFLCTQVLLS